MTAYWRDIRRTILKERKRLIALIIITILGVTMTTGLAASCDDLRLSADAFFDEQNLHDLMIQSTLGLTDEDISALEQMDEIEEAQGFYSETMQVKVADGSRSLALKTFTEDGIDRPYVTEGRLPEQADEIAVAEGYLKDSGKKIGDKVTLIEDVGEDETATLVNTEFTITGSVVDVTQVDNTDGTVSFRSSSETDYSFFVLPQAVNSDYYTAVLLIVKGSSELQSYSSAYTDLINEVTEKIETQIKEKRQQERYDELLTEAKQKIADAQEEMQESFDEAEEKLEDSKEELEDGKKQLKEGENELEEQAASAREQLAEAREQIESGLTQLNEGSTRLDESEKQLAEGEAKLDAGEEELLSAKAQLEEGEKQLQTAQAQLDENDASLEEAEAQLEEGTKQLESGKEELEQKEEESKTQFAAAKSSLEENKNGILQKNEELQSQEEALKESFGEEWPTQEWEALKKAGSSGEGEEEQTQLLKEKMGSAYQESYAQLALELGKGQAELSALESQEASLAEQESAAQEEFAQAKQELQTQEESLTAAKEKLTAGRRQWEEGSAKTSAAQAQLSESRSALTAGFEELNTGRAELDAAKEQILSGRSQLEDARQELQSGQTQLEEKEDQAEEEIAAARQELEEGKEELADGEDQYKEALATYEKEKKDAEQKLEEEKGKLDELETASWYIQSRSNLDGYSNISSDAECIGSLGTAFSAMFLIVAILISLTTIARMVEEDRSLMGTYQALGFTNREILGKYVVYSLSASVIGGILGNLAGFVLMPKIIFRIFTTMYLIPEFFLKWNAIYGIAAAMLFLLGILAATCYSCSNALKHMPAVLMQPKAPKAGSRILLERWSSVWKKMSFLNKVTARNIFRYKKRFLMTVFGIAGCTGLLLCGFSIKNTVDDLMPRQYDEINQYDLLAATNGQEDNEKLLDYVDRSEIADYVNIQISSVKLTNEAGESLNLQLYILPDADSLDGYIGLYDKEKNSVSIGDDGFYITENAGTVLGFGEGDTVTLQDLQLNQFSGKVEKILENYLGNSVFVTQSFYEQHVKEYEANAVLLHFSEGTDPYEMAQWLEEQDGVLSVTSTAQLKDSFSQSFGLINMVVYVIILMAAALAFVVLFTLATTNISERERELATIKVLGFYDPEVHRYVNKESILLTLIGIVAGLPLGYGLGQFLMLALKLPSINFAVTVHTSSYFLAGILSLIFSLGVNIITNRVLDRIDPAEALKSVE